MTPAVSVLVPVYNVSAYIERCAYSLFGQTFDNIEFVFVNDCTPDNSIEKLQHIIAKYPNRNVKIIHHEKNRGLAAARNTAIDNATGKYIQHIDSDDWIEPNMIEAMYHKAETEQADIVVCDFVIERKNETVLQKETINDQRKTPFELMLENEEIGGWLFSKFIKSELCKMPECRSMEGLNYQEDRYVSTKIFYYARKFAKIDKTFYHYDRANQSSITATCREYHIEQRILFWDLIDQFMEKNNIRDTYSSIIECSKTKTKIYFFLSTQSYHLRKKYAYLYRNFEMKYISQFPFGAKLMLIFTHYKMFLLAHWVQKIIWWKNK